MPRTSLVALIASVPALLLPMSSAQAQPRKALDDRADADALATVASHTYTNLCNDDVSTGAKRCLAKVVTDASGKALSMHAPPRGALGPADLQSAYKLPTSGGAGKTIALVDAFHYTNAEKDLAMYRATYGLAPCTTANGCFKQVDATGAPSTVKADPMGCNGWAGEAALDLQMASATCPDCNILLVEVDGAGGDFSGAVNEAASLGAVAISNSYGGSDTIDDPAYNHPGILITAANGDTGYAVSAPASYTGVVAVGGTTLTKSASSRGWAEASWSLSGSGCSKKVAKPSWQTDTACGKRVLDDVAAVADPNTGLAIYCSDSKGGGWGIVGGTSAATPIVAGAFTVMNVSTAPSFIWENPTSFFDITTGPKDGTCTTAILCMPGPGWDGPTGWGSPNGALLMGGATNLANDAGVDDSGADSSLEGGSDSGSSNGAVGGDESGTGGDEEDGSASSSSGAGSSSSSSSGGTASSGGSSGAVGSSGSSSGGSSSSGTGGSSGAVADAGGAPQDAGAPALDAGATGGGGGTSAPSSGCGCSTAGARQGYGAAGFAGFLFLAWTARRRRLRPTDR